MFLIFDQGGVGGAVPCVALEQARHWVQHEPQQRAVGLGEVQRALHGPSGRGRAHHHAGTRSALA